MHTHPSILPPGGSIGVRVSSCPTESGSSRRQLVKSPPSAKAVAFTLIETLVAGAVLALIMALLLSVVSQTASVWRHSTQDIEAFQGARQAFQVLTRNLSLATLNTYWDYEFNAQGIPTRYRRNSELQFVIHPAGMSGFPGTPNTGQAVFFQAELGRKALGYTGEYLPYLLNTLGFYVEFNSNAAWFPSMLNGRLDPAYRFRLMQVLEPSENFSVYTGTENPSSWMPMTGAYPLADNIIALVIAPRRSPAEEVERGPLVTELAYDSRVGAASTPQAITANQLPPVLQVSLIAIDEQSARRLANGTAVPPALSAALANRFKNLSAYEDDLKAVESALRDHNINYQVFSTSIPLRESKWSE